MLCNKRNIIAINAPVCLLQAKDPITPEYCSPHLCFAYQNKTFLLSIHVSTLRSSRTGRWMFTWTLRHTGRSIWYRYIGMTMPLVKANFWNKSWNSFSCATIEHIGWIIKDLFILFIIYLQYFKRVKKTHLAIWLFYHVTLYKTIISIQSTYIHVPDKNMH